MRNLLRLCQKYALLSVLRRTFESQDGRVRKVEIAFCILHEEKCFVSNNKNLRTSQADTDSQSDIRSESFHPQYAIKNPVTISADDIKGIAAMAATSIYVVYICRYIGNYM